MNNKPTLIQQINEYINGIDIVLKNSPDCFYDVDKHFEGQKEAYINVKKMLECIVEDLKKEYDECINFKSHSHDARTIDYEEDSMNGRANAIDDFITDIIGVEENEEE